MATQNAKSQVVRERARLLRDDPPSILKEGRKRRVQQDSGVLTTTINRQWAAELGIDQQSAPTSQYYFTGTKPVVVTGPAIVIQPNGGELGRDSE